MFAPVVRMEIVWLLIAMAAHGGWEVHHMDIKLAFLNGELAEEVFVEQPPVSSMTSMGIWCSSYARHCTVCGKRAWNSKLDSSLVSLGFERSPKKHIVYRRAKGRSFLLVWMYIGDLIITG